MLFEISHKERPCDQGILNPYIFKDKKQFSILEAAKDFLCNKFSFKYHGAFFLEGRTISLIEAPSEKIVWKCIRMGTPIFAKLTGYPYDDIRVEASATERLDIIKKLLGNLDKNAQSGTELGQSFNLLFLFKTVSPLGFSGSLTHFPSASS